MDPKHKWNKKYVDRLQQNKKAVPNARLQSMLPYLRGGTAVDLACGLGANSLFLAKLKYTVTALDISDVAVNHLKRQAKTQNLPIHVHATDLTKIRELPLPENSIDLVVISYYLNREILPFVKTLIKEGGYFFMETYYLSNIKKQTKVSDKYKLLPGELLNEFAHWKVLYYEEYEHVNRQTIFARKNY